METIAWSTYDVNPDNLVKVFGGVASGTGPFIWTPPDTQPEIEMSVKLTDRNGNVLTVVRAKLTAKKNLSFQASKLGQIDITAKVLTPTKAATPKYTLSMA